GFWVVYGLFWHLIFAPEPLTGPNLLISGILTLWQAVATYVHIRFLLQPRYSGLLSIPLYAVGTLLVIVVASLLSWTNLYAFFWSVLGDRALDVFLKNGWQYWTGALLGGMTMAVAFTGAIYLFGRRRDQEKREAELEKARTEAELAYLRGQLNPHFLFNALNSIHVLIPRSPEEAQQALEGFSDLLRYQLYRSDEKLVPLAEELAHLHKFAELSRLRLEEDFLFALQVPATPGEVLVPPMLLLPLLENAIKYSPKMGGKVTGITDLKEGRLHFTLTNKVGKPVVIPQNEQQAGGIGLTNIRRRLQLLFPQDHTFTTTEQAGHYTVHLEIPLSE
ncbi:MAG: histidine kinase, partial [Bacteroidota bacterium]